MTSEIGKNNGTGTYAMSGGTLNVSGQMIFGTTSTAAGLGNATGFFNISPNPTPGGSDR